MALQRAEELADGDQAEKDEEDEEGNGEEEDEADEEKDEEDEKKGRDLDEVEESIIAGGPVLGLLQLHASCVYTTAT